MSNYLKKIEKSAKSKEEAIELALQELGVSEDEVTITVVEEAAKGFLGLGTKEATVLVEVNDIAILRIKKFLADVFAGFNIDVQIDAKRDENGISVELSGDSMGIVIGKRGETLDSLQYLAPSLLGCLCVAEPEDIELLAGFGVINPSHRTHTVLDGDGIILALLCVDIQQHVGDHLLFYLVGLGIPHLVGHLAPQSVAVLTAQRCRHQL